MENGKQKSDVPNGLKVKTKKRPEVRQTLTSYKRLLNANPLLKLEQEGIDINKLLSENASTSNSLRKNDFKKPGSKPLQRSQSLKLVKKPTNTIISSNKPNSNSSKNIKSLNFNGSTKCSKLEFNTANSRLLSSTPIEMKPKVNKVAPVRNETASRVASSKIITKDKTEKPNPQIPKNLTRRSLSAGHINRTKGKTEGGYQFDPKMSYHIRSASTEQVERVENLKGYNSVFSSNVPFSPILEENRSSSRSNSFIFKTPSAYERRSVSHFTPRTGNRRSLIGACTPAAVQKQLQERLNAWLTKRGKSLSSFHHLQCFGLHNKKKADLIDEENKENVETTSEGSEKGSYEDLRIIDTEPENNEIKNMENVAKEALIDLHNLILEGYPREHCEAWLGLIREKYKNLEEEPEYWECRAAIEQSVGNIGSAVEFYKTAIVQGAEIDTVDKSLDQLLQKFSLLDISTSKREKTDKERERIVKDARHVFKSSIIQFAVQERKLKRNHKKSDESNVKLVATPVRRSTRLSRSAYVSTPGLKICSSLKELETSGEKVDFQMNKALC